ncbi:MAG: hypothetical protein RQ982_13640 [Gammaproteobacteria bacterium]|nr:hypothetical protein [Gammaproteobacteria bacterium]
MAEKQSAYFTRFHRYLQIDIVSLLESGEAMNNAGKTLAKFSIIYPCVLRGLNNLLSGIIIIRLFQRLV